MMKLFLLLFVLLSLVGCRSTEETVYLQNACAASCGHPPKKMVVPADRQFGIVCECQ